MGGGSHRSQKQVQSTESKKLPGSLSESKSTTTSTTTIPTIFADEKLNGIINRYLGSSSSSSSSSSSPATIVATDDTKSATSSAETSTKTGTVVMVYDNKVATEIMDTMGMLITLLWLVAVGTAASKSIYGIILIFVLIAAAIVCINSVKLWVIQWLVKSMVSMNVTSAQNMFVTIVDNDNGVEKGTITFQQLTDVAIKSDKSSKSEVAIDTDSISVVDNLLKICGEENSYVRKISVTSHTVAPIRDEWVNLTSKQKADAVTVLSTLYVALCCDGEHMRLLNFSNDGFPRTATNGDNANRLNFQGLPFATVSISAILMSRIYINSMQCMLRLSAREVDTDITTYLEFARSLQSLADTIGCESIEYVRTHKTKSIHVEIEYIDRMISDIQSNSEACSLIRSSRSMLSKSFVSIAAFGKILEIPSTSSSESTSSGNFELSIALDTEVADLVKYLRGKLASSLLSTVPS